MFGCLHLWQRVCIECYADFNVLLADLSFWPSNLLGELLDLPFVAVIPVRLPTSIYQLLSFPNPVAYVPQHGLGSTENMVSTHSAASLCACLQALALPTSV